MGLEPAVAWWQRRGYQKHQLKDQYYVEWKETNLLYGVLEWSHASTLQLQRLAHEETGNGIWSECDGDTLVTLPGHQLAPLTLSIVKHFVLKKLRTKGQWESDRKGWEWIIAVKPYGFKRSDTGPDTLVEEMEERKGGTGIARTAGSEMENVSVSSKLWPQFGLLCMIAMRYDAGEDHELGQTALGIEP